MQKHLQRQRIRPALPAHPGQAQEKTDPALRMQQVFPLTDEGRAAAAQCLQDAFNAEPDRWKHCPDMMDCDPWEPPAEEQAEE